MDIREQKKNLRLSILDRLKKMSDVDRERESRSLCRRLIDAAPSDATICAYWPLKTEPDIRSFITELLDRGQRIYLPCFANKLVFRELTDCRTLSKGELGIMEPPKDAPVAEPDTVDIVLVPGRAYDRQGNRLGRGNGGYDIWIEKQRTLNPRTQYWGVAYERQIVTEIPMEDHDAIVDAIVTTRGMLEMA